MDDGLVLRTVEAHAHLEVPVRGAGTAGVECGVDLGSGQSSGTLRNEAMVVVALRVWLPRHL